MNNKMDIYIDSLQDGQEIDYYGNGYFIKESDSTGCILIPSFSTDDVEGETMKVTWSDIAEQTLDDELPTN